MKTKLHYCLQQVLDLCVIWSLGQKTLGFSLPCFPYCIWQDSGHITQSCHQLKLRPLRKCCAIDPWASLSASSAKITQEYVVHLTIASACKVIVIFAVILILKNKHHVMMRGMMMMHHSRFESLANHRSGVKLITLGAVSWRQPGDIYLWTHVSNLAITIPLINSLPESLPGEQEFRDSDRLMMLVSCNSVALKLYSDYARVKKTIQINGIPLNVMIYMNHCLSTDPSSKVHCQRKAWMFVASSVFSGSCSWL